MNPVMTPLEHLRQIDMLAFDKAAYCEFRAHIIAIQDALEINSKKDGEHLLLQTEHTKLKETTSKEIAELAEKNNQLYLRYIEAKSGKEDEPPDPPWPSPRLNHNF